MRDDRFKITTRSHSCPHPVNDAAAIRRAAGLALKRAELTRPLRLLGVRVDGLVRIEPGEVAPSPVEQEEYAQGQLF